MGMVMQIRPVKPDEVTRLEKGQLDAWECLDDNEAEYLDKAWHGLHFLLCGDAWDAKGILGEALMGGAEVGEDGGYGSPSLVSPQTAAAVHAALSQLSEADLEARFDPDKFEEEEIYPQMWDEPQAVNYPLGYLSTVQQVYAQAAAMGGGVLMGIS